MLTGKYNQGRSGVDGRLAEGEWGKALVNERSVGIARTVVEIAQELGRSPAQVAIAWIRAQDSEMIPILGASKLPQLEDNLGALSLELAPQQLARLDEVSRIELGFPHDFLESPTVRFLIHGNHGGKLDRPRGR